MKPSKIFLLSSIMILFSSNLYASDTDCEDNNRTEQGAGIIIDGICVDPLELPYPDRPDDCGDDMKLLQGNDNNCTDGIEAPDPGPYPPVPSTPCPAGKIVDQGTGECTLNAPSTTEPLPVNLTIDNIALQKWIVSTYDDTPYNPPLDIQGIIDANGLAVSVPYTVVTSQVRLPARRTSVTLDASITQDGESGIIATFAWAGKVLPVGSGYFTAIITIDDSAGDNDGVYNAKKLDIDATETGGLAVTAFSYAVDNTVGIGSLALKILSGIPDRMFGLADNTGNDTVHEFLYVPVSNATTGETWLSNNLGANYANVNSPEFNITKQATLSTDFNAYGSSFQWGRKADGHELINWVNGTSGSASNGTIPTQSDDPTHALFIRVYGDWRVTPDDTLWTSESSPNNVCPVGYRVPIGGELKSEAESWTDSNSSGAISSTLKLPTPGYRDEYGRFYDNGNYGFYWGTTLSMYGVPEFLSIDSDSTEILGNNRSKGLSVRCIKD